MDLARILATDILPRVEKPSRYLGTEVNAVRPEDKADARVRIALAFPDLYDLGLGNLGLHILYAMVNRLPWASAERAYAPGLDMEALLRENGLPLFAIESKRPLGEFDGIGFTLQSELTFTNILNMIDLAGLPLRTAHRRPDDPLTFAGGPAVFNPEPLAPFMDFFVIGDGEEVLIEICEVLDRVADREGRLDALARVEGVYVPARYEMDVLPDGRILPPVDGPKIRKRTTPALDGNNFPVNYIVPFTRQVHDRISLEVLRGCTQGCRFCQAGMTTRPVRERSIEGVDDLMRRTLETTGYEEVSLVSLSTCDHSRVRQLVDTAVKRAVPARVSVSLPSLRLDSFSVELADMVADIRRTGLTFAPEAASPRLRAVINKWIPDEELLDMATQAYSRGWGHVKLYFMIGLPTERDDDIEAIADLTLKTLETGRRHNRGARVNTGVSTFVPKPFTPFQWAPQLDIDETHRRQRILDGRFRYERGVKFGRHHAQDTFLEGQVSRADRRAADLIEAAFRLGARFDAWDEHRDFRIWQQAMEQLDWDPAYELRERGLDERLPWDHIDIHIPKQWFQEDWQRAVELQHAQDCRHSKCHRCGVIDVERDLCAHMLRNAIDGRKEEKVWVRPGAQGPVPIPKGATARAASRKELLALAEAEAVTEQPAPPPPEPRAKRYRQPERSFQEPPPVQRLVFRIGVVGEARFLSHLETVNAWLRSLRRAQTPLSYSQGFHPHPKMAFSGARPVGEQTLGDYLDVTLSQRVDPSALLARFQATLPPGFRAFGVNEVPLKSPALMSTVSGADFLVYVPAGAHAVLPESEDAAVEVDRASLERRVAHVLGREEIIVRRVGKKKRRGRKPPRIFDIRRNLRSLAVEPGVPGESEALGAVERDDLYVVRLGMDVVDGRGAKPVEIVAAMGLDPERCRVVRLETHFSHDYGPVLAPETAVPEPGSFAGTGAPA